MKDPIQEEEGKLIEGDEDEDEEKAKTKNKKKK